MTSLVKQIDQQLDAVAGKTPRAMGVFVIFLNNTEGLDKRLLAIAEKESLKRVSFGIGIPPEDYEVNQEAGVTAVIYNPARRPSQKVKANFALRKCELDKTNREAIVKAISEVLPK